MISINSSTAQLAAQRMYAVNQFAMFTALERLATGYRINRASDDPAGLIASENLRSTLAGLEAEARALQRSDHVANVAEGALNTTSDALAEAKGLVVAAANSSGLSDEEKEALQLQLDSILNTVDATASNTSFAGEDLLDGTATLTAGDTTVDLPAAGSSDLGETEIDGTTYTLADLRSGGELNLVDGDLESAAQILDNAINEVSTARGEIGSFQRYTIDARVDNIQSSIETLSAANSLIRDTDYAVEIAALNRSFVLQSASLAAMSLMASPTGILQLLGS